MNNGTVGPSVIDVDEKTQVRIIRQQSVRVATEGDDVFIYHNFDNPRLETISTLIAKPYQFLDCI